MSGKREKITPDEEFVKSSNVYNFSSSRGFSSVEELRNYSYRNESFWGEIVDYLGIEFDEEYENLKTGEGKDARWFTGGKINIAKNLAEDGLAVKTVRESGMTTLSYEELDKYSDSVAWFLHNEKGVRKGDTVGLCLPMDSLSVVTFYSIFKLGAIATPIFTGYSPSKIRERAEISDCDLIITEKGFQRNRKEIQLGKKVQDSIEDLEDTEKIEIDLKEEKIVLEDKEISQRDFRIRETYSNDPCLLIFTSGTTGRPKGTIHTHAGFLVKVMKDLHFDFDLKDKDNFLWLTDPGWIMGAWSIVGVNSIGSTLVTYTGSPRIDNYQKIPDLISRHDIDVFGATPEFFRNLDYEYCQQKNFENLKIIGSTGERLEENIWKKLKYSFGEENIPIINVSGGTEAGGHFLSPLPTDTIPASSVGKPSLGFDVEILNEIGEKADKGSLTISSSTPSLTKSLWEGDSRYEEEYWNNFPGFWDHGDVVERNSSGFLYVLGRKDHLINYKGYRISPQRYEGSLNDIKGLKDSLLLEDENKLILCIEESGKVDEGYLKSKIAEKQGRPFIPDRVERIETIPYNQSGKKDRSKVLGLVQN